MQVSNVTCQLLEYLVLPSLLSHCLRLIINQQHQDDLIAIRGVSQVDNQSDSAKRSHHVQAYDSLDN
jgi:hypothetical protein